MVPFTVTEEVINFDPAGAVVVIWELVVVCVENENVVVVDFGNEEVLDVLMNVVLGVVWVELAEELVEVEVVDVVGVVEVVRVVVGVEEVEEVVEVGLVVVDGVVTEVGVVCEEDVVGDEVVVVVVVESGVDVDVISELVWLVSELDRVAETLRDVLEFVRVGEDDSEEDALLWVDIVDVTVEVV